MKFIRIFSIVALFILIIACINYINLSTARSEKRAKEVGLRKVVGARRMQIAWQFFAESVLFTLIALGIALFLIQLLEGVFHDLTGKTLVLADFKPGFVLGLLLITGFTGLASGVYPALVLSNIIAWPVAYLAMRSWLDNYSFRTSLGLPLFLLSAAAALLITMITVSFQAVRAARANPVDSLRYE